MRLAAARCRWLTSSWECHHPGWHSAVTLCHTCVWTVPGDDTSAMGQPWYDPKQYPKRRHYALGKLCKYCLLCEVARLWTNTLNSHKCKKHKTSLGQPCYASSWEHEKLEWCFTEDKIKRFLLDYPWGRLVRREARWPYPTQEQWLTTSSPPFSTSSPAKCFWSDKGSCLPWEIAHFPVYSPLSRQISFCPPSTCTLQETALH